MTDQAAAHGPMELNDRLEEPQPITHVRVINRNTFPIEDKFNSEEFVFEPGKRLVIPYVVAQHIFGLGLPPKEQLQHCQKRFGWNTPATMDAARMHFDNISIAPVYMRLVEVTPPPDFVDEPPRRPGRPPGRSRYKAPGETDGEPPHPAS